MLDHQILNLNCAQTDSFDCMFGIDPISNSPKNYHDTIRTFAQFISRLDQVFITFSKDQWPERKEAIFTLLRNSKFDENEINRYAFVDEKFPYTRNLVCTDNENYSLLLLCWSAYQESKIHNHPCDGCFVKTIKHSVKETLYSYDETKESIEFVREYKTSEGEVTYMDDSIGLHKIGNTNNVPGEAAFSLHLYTPPYFSSKVT